MTQKDEKQCKHDWIPFGERAVTSLIERTPGFEIKYVYHWYCRKCKQTKITESEWRMQ